MRFSVRQVNTNDHEVRALLLRMQRETLPGDVPLLPSTGYWWIAFADGKPAGFAALQASIRWQDTGYLSRAGVLAAYRGRGLQKRLIKVRIAKARELGWQWLLSDTSDNTPSANALISSGFKLYEPMRPYGLKNALYWRRKI